jgi:hypothetical protein
MINRLLQLFLLTCALAVPALAAVAQLRPGAVHHVALHDVDGNSLSTAGGRVTVITVMTRKHDRQSREIGDSIPERFKGDPRFRYITVLNFQRKIAGPFHGITRTIIRHRLDSEAKELREVYADNNVKRDARLDMHVVADFDGEAVTKLGLNPDADTLAVFVFDPRGKLLARWDDVPPAGMLAKTVEAALQ